MASSVKMETSKASEMSEAILVSQKSLDCLILTLLCLNDVLIGDGERRVHMHRRGGT